MLKTTIIGYIGRDAETRTMQDGSAVTNFSVAHTDVYTDRQTGERREHTTWLNCAFWNAGAVKDYLKQGTFVYVEGFPSMRSYQNQQGGTSVSFDLRVLRVDLLASPKPKEQPAAAQAPQQQEQPAGQDEPKDVWGDQ